MTIFAYKNLVFIFLIYFMLMNCAEQSSAYSGRPGTLGRGISIGNALEAPIGESWGVEMKEQYFDSIKNAGFDSVRLPLRLSQYLNRETDTLDEDFLKRIDGYINHGLSLGLNIILDLHHFTEIMDNPAAERENLLIIWRQLSERYRNYPGTLVFELLNEPRGKLDVELWNQYLREVIAVIRESSADRPIVVGGAPFNLAEGLETLSLPEDDNIIVTFHYYQPAEFTFQGNPYHTGYESLSGIHWTPGDGELARIREDFKRVGDWAARNNTEVFLGEFGAVNTIPFEYRGEWTLAIVTIAEEFGFSWCYWELGSWFGIMDTENMLWDYNMLRVLLREQSSR